MSGALVTKQCPLCGTADELSAVQGSDARAYFLCPVCRLVFADPRHHLSAADEAARYQLHQNSPADAGYVAFLRQAIDPMLPRLEPGMRGLDYGCGPGPTLSILLAAHGLRCEDYDPLFRPIEPAPPYDFIFATECVEHFFRPREEFARLHALLRPAGSLAIMTERWTSLEQLAKWYYLGDPTHVAFYHDQTFDYVCREFGFARLPCENRRVTLLERR